MESLSKLWKMISLEIGRLKYYILAAAVLFGFGVYSGITSEGLDELLMQTTQEVFGEINQQISESDNPTQTSIMLIFLNNVRAVLIMMYAGIALAIFPIFSMIFNGILVGFVLRVQQSLGGASISELIFKGLLPHGLFELPAIFIAAAFGMRLGVTVVLRIFPSLRERTQKVGEVAKAGLPLAGFLIVLLLVASIIESTITRWLLLG